MDTKDSRFSELLESQKESLRETKTIRTYIEHIDEMMMLNLRMSPDAIKSAEKSVILQEKTNEHLEQLTEARGKELKELEARSAEKSATLQEKTNDYLEQLTEARSEELKESRKFAIELAKTTKSFNNIFDSVKNSFKGLKNTFSSKENFKIAALGKLNFGGIFNKAIEKQKFIRQEKALGNTDSSSAIGEQFKQRNKVIKQIKDNEAEIAKEAEYQGTTPDKLAPTTDRAKGLLAKREQLADKFSTLDSRSGNRTAQPVQKSTFSALKEKAQSFIPSMFGAKTSTPVKANDEKLKGNFSSLSSKAKNEQLTGNFSSSNRNAVLDERQKKLEEKEQKTQTRLLAKIEKDIPDKQANIVGKASMSSLGEGGEVKAGSSGKLGKGLLGITGALAAIGAGIGAFFLALAGTDMIMSYLGDGSTLKKLLTNIGEGLSAFSGPGLVALGALLGAGALFGMVSTKVAGRAAVGMAAIGFGLGGFFTGLAVGDGLASLMGADGTAIKNMMVNLAEGLGAFSGPSLVALGALLGAGALFGAVPFVGKQLAKGAAVGMTAIGFGLGGFFLGLGTGDKFMKIFGMDGSTIKVMMINLAEGLNAFANIDGENLLKAGEGLAALAVGMAKMAGAGLLEAGSSFFSDIFSALTFWKDDEDPTEKFTVYTKLAKYSDDFKKIGEGLTALGAGLVAFATGAREISKVKSIDLSSLDTIDAEKIRIAAQKLAPIKGIGQDLMAIKSLSSENEITKISNTTPAVNVVDTSSNVTNVSNNKNVIGRNPVKNSDPSLRNYNNNSSLQFVH